MKYLVVIGLVALLLLLLLRRLRPYLRLVQQFINTLRQVQQASANRTNARNAQPEKLVCCETCGTWIPIGRALASGSRDAVFCSTRCLSTRKSRRHSAS